MSTRVRLVIAFSLMASIIAICTNLYEYSKRDASNLSHTLELFSNYQDFID
jgi:hypothetical protein